MGFHSGNWYSFIRYDEDQDQPQVSAGMLRRVAGFAKSYWRWVTLTLVTIIGISLLSLVPPLLIRNLIDVALPEKDVTRLSLLALGMIAVPIINGLLGVAQRYASSTVGEGLIFDLRSEVYAHLQRMSLRFYTHTQTGEMMSRLNNDVVGAQRAVTGTLVTIVSDSISLIATLAIMTALDWRLTLLSVAILPLFILPARRVGRVLRQIAREQMNLNARMNALMNETLNISGALLVKIFGRYATEVGRFRERAADVRDIGIRQAFVGRWFFLSLSLVTAIGTATVFWLGGYLVIVDIFTLGTLIAFTAYLVNLYGPLMALTNARVDFATSMVSFERVFEVLDLPIEIQDRPNAVSIVRAEGNVRFEQVCFSYIEEGEARSGLEEVSRFSWGGRGAYVPPTKTKDGKSPDGEEKAGNGRGRKPEERRWALKDLSFEMKAGQVAALVGPSGAGKSTITYLLPRLYDPTEGRVTLDGIDLRDIMLESLAGQVGMVTQETFLFHDTVRNNLLYAKDDATPEQIEEACRAAHIHEFIEQLSDGYDTLVGERGYRLSGGEKQRVAIARVILKDPKVLILDEATSHLDSRSESLIQSAMERVMKGRTSLVIAHRLSTIIGADWILVMDQGRLVEQGRHQELLARGGLYHTLYETQFKEGLLREREATDRLQTAPETHREP
ncbi:MAG: ABC transporter ATP-binding protein [Anaerolineae bacterium]|nr:MAG: ABC transporter ATP-binding protein [Anaerolineae bacterium]